MDSKAEGWTLGELAAQFGGTLEGDPSRRVLRPVPAHSDDEAGIAFAEGKYIEAALTSGVGALIVARDAGVIGKPHIRVDHPRAAFGMLLAMADRPLSLAVGIHPTAIVHPSARISDEARIGAYVTVGAESVVDAGVKLHPGVSVGDRCVVGANAVLYPQVVLVQDVTVGARCILHSHCVLGADGFGFVWDGAKRQKIPQVGQVVLEDDVEVGAGTCIDRATCGETRIKAGTKLDNMVQIGHNSSVGEHSVIAGHASIAGSVTIGARATIAGQAAIKDHVTVADDVVLAGRSGVMKDIEQGGQYFGYPSVPMREGMRQMAAIQALPELMKRVKQLEAEVALLREGRE